MTLYSSCWINRCTRVPVSIIFYNRAWTGPFNLHMNSRQGKNVPKILDSNSRQKKISVIEALLRKLDSMMNLLCSEVKPFLR
jgi:hypothetical protein